MRVRSVSFDDDSDDDLFVFSGDQLLTSHYDTADLDWAEVAERSTLDERRGLVIAQVAVLEDLLDEVILYIADPHDIQGERTKLNRLTLGPRIDLFERMLNESDLAGPTSSPLLDQMREVVKRRNELAHGTLHWRPVGGVPTLGTQTEVSLEWIISNRRSGEMRRITMSQLRSDLLAAIACFTSLLEFAERAVESVPTPRHFEGGRYIGTA